MLTHIDRLTDITLLCRVLDLVDQFNLEAPLEDLTRQDKKLASQLAPAFARKKLNRLLSDGKWRRSGAKSNRNAADSPTTNGADASSPNPSNRKL